MSKLDQLSFVPERLGKPRMPGSVELQQEIAVIGSERSVSLQLPFLLRDVADLGEDWSPFCGLLKQEGIALQSSVGALEELPASAVPMRLARQHVDEAFDPVEVSTADLIEFSFRQSDCASWVLPEELGAVGRLPAFLGALREAASGNAPVGIEMSLGMSAEDIQAICEMQVDFISLSEDASVGRSQDLLMWSVAKVAELSGEIPLIVNAHLEDDSEIPKLMALGANFVCLDSLLNPMIPEREEDHSGYSAGRLSSLGVTAAPQQSETIAAIEKWFDSLNGQLKQQMLYCGAASLAEFNSGCLRAASPSAAALSGTRSFH
ncbi:MAG: hypothetical protein AAF483_13325 [Planctomycetota bacterium]